MESGEKIALEFWWTSEFINNVPINGKRKSENCIWSKNEKWVAKPKMGPEETYLNYAVRKSRDLTLDWRNKLENTQATICIWKREIAQQ